ncbi:hypothetical protein O5D80_001549 [Batrachochytrium dendrobatidis]|nr:hypothetical protein O5D80_000018 [Batrachochytrium dendrobatidis]KAJ8330533.1 hypothetical protein O5D80_001511 [Batrachochytrium dendrobatidis]KAJ8330574.1 hypothetical protein O5D80_001549 [Batrachochytrium dendrobatidis]
MKLAVTVLASILFACSVTTAKPVNPSATTSAEASTSTVTPTPTKTTSTVFEDRVLYYKEATSSVDLSKFSEDDMGLIKGYLEKDQKCEDIKKAHDSAKSEELNQEESLRRVLGESYELFMKYSNRNDPVYQEKREIIKQKIDEENEKFLSLQQKRLKLDKNLYYAGLLLRIARENLAKLLLQNDPSTASLHSFRIFLESNRNFVEDIYQSLILQLNKQSGTQNKSKHHKSPSSSSKTSTDQPTQTSSSTQKASKSSKSHSRSRSRKTSKSKNERKSFLSPPSSEDSDESPV